MDNSYLFHRVDKIACEILGCSGQNKSYTDWTTKKKNNIYNWRECKRCSTILTGTAPSFDTYLKNIYTPEVLAPMSYEESPFRAFLKNR